jgi:hypothetical protein
MDVKKTKKLIARLSELEESKASLVKMVERLLNEDAAVNEVIFSSLFSKNKDGQINPVGMLDIIQASLNGDDELEILGATSVDVSIELNSREMVEMLGIMLKSISAKIKHINKELSK